VVYSLLSTLYSLLEATTSRPNNRLLIDRHHHRSIDRRRQQSKVFFGFRWRTKILVEGKSTTCSSRSRFVSQFRTDSSIHGGFLYSPSSPDSVIGVLAKRKIRQIQHFLEEADPSTGRLAIHTIHCNGRNDEDKL
jgi:hypothetical protein